MRQLGVRGRPLLSCLTLLRTCPHRGDVLAWGVQTLHDEGMAGDDLVLETASRCDKLVAEDAAGSRPIPTGFATENGAGRMARPGPPPGTGPTGRAMHAAREAGDVCDFFLAEAVSSIEVEHGDVAPEAWEATVCESLERWSGGTAEATGSRAGEGGEDILVMDAAATAMQSVARRFIQRRRLRARLREIAEAAAAEEERRAAAAAAAAEAAIEAAAAAARAADAGEASARTVREGVDAARALTNEATAAASAAMDAALEGTVAAGAEKLAEVDTSPEVMAAREAAIEAREAAEVAAGEAAAAAEAAGVAKTAADSSVAASEAARDESEAAEAAAEEAAKAVEANAGDEAAAEALRENIARKSTSSKAAEAAAAAAEAPTAAFEAANERAEATAAAAVAAREVAEAAEAAVLEAEENALLSALTAAAKPPDLERVQSCADRAALHLETCARANEGVQLLLRTLAPSRASAEEAAAAAAAAVVAAGSAAEVGEAVEAPSEERAPQPPAAGSAAEAGEAAEAPSEEGAPQEVSEEGGAKRSAATAAEHLAAVVAGLNEVGACAAAATTALERATAAFDGLKALADRVAAVMIQARARGISARAAYEKARVSALYIQRVAKGFLAMTKYQRVQKSAAYINRVARGYSARKRVWQMRSDARRELEATLLIQSCFRGRVARRRVKATIGERATCLCGRVASGEMLSCQVCCEFYHAHCVRASRWRDGPDWNRAAGVPWTCPRCLPGLGSMPVGSGAAAALAAAALDASAGVVSVGSTRRAGSTHAVDDPPLGLAYTRVRAVDARDLKALAAAEPGLITARPPPVVAPPRSPSSAQTSSPRGRSLAAAVAAEMGSPLVKIPASRPASQGATGKGARDRMDRVRGRTSGLGEVETRLNDGVGRIESAALQRLPAPVMVDGVPWAAGEAAPGEEVMEALRGPNRRARVPAQIGTVLRGGGDHAVNAAEEAVEAGATGLRDGPRVSTGGGGKGKKAGGKKGASKQGGQAPRSSEGKAAKKLRAGVKAARKKGGALAKAAAAAASSEKAMGAAVAKRRPPPAAEEMNALRKSVLVDWRLQPATMTILPGATVGKKKEKEREASARSSSGFTSRVDARGHDGTGPMGAPRASLQGRQSTMSMGSQADIV